jgi:photosystem II stability/assembly factor-like uncharacterized protein
MARSCRWTPLGPIGVITSETNPGFNVASGRVTALAVHPFDSKSVYAGTAGGGVWKTIDRGQIWRPLTDREASLAIGAIAIDPSNPDRIFAGTGEGNDAPEVFNGAGLLLSEDAGKTWDRIAVPAARATRIFVAPSGSRIYLASTDGLFESTDHGRTWQSLSNEWVTDVVYDEAGDRLYAALHADGVYARTGGARLAALGQSGPNAQRLPGSKSVSGARIALAWIPSQKDTILAAYTQQFGLGGVSLLYGVFRSDDAGATWSAVVVPLADPTKATGIFMQQQANYNLVFARNPNVATDLFLGLNDLYRSTNLGASLVAASSSDSSATDDPGESVPLEEDGHDDQHAMAFPSSGDDVWLGNDGGVWVSTDRGQTWAHRNRGLATVQYYGGAHHADVSALLLAGSQDNASEFRDGHPLWRKSTGGDAGDVAIDAVNRRAWVATNKGEVDASERLDERPESFIVVNRWDDKGPFFSRIALAPSSPNIAYRGYSQPGQNDAALVPTPQGHLYQADLNLKPWWLDIKEFADSGAQPVAALVVAWNNPRLVYVADVAGVVYKVEVGSPNSVVTALAQLPIATTPAIEHLAVSPRDEQRVYVAVSEAFGSTTRTPKSRLFRFNAASSAWEDLTPRLVGFPVGGTPIDPRVNAIHSIAIDPDPSIADAAHEHIYVGCDRGVLQSFDGGDSWQAIVEGLPLTPVYDLAFHAKDRLLRAFTHGRGAWERPADVPPCSAPPFPVEVDLYVRDYRYDVGLTPAQETLLDPVRRDGAKVKSKEEQRVTLAWTDAPDLKVDREAIGGEQPSGFQQPASTVDYAGGALDCIGFEALAHRDPRRGAPARLYLQIHNRGPDAATNVVARAFYAVPASDGWPDLPADFWTAFPDSDPAAASPWKPIGAKSTVAEVRPAEPEVIMLPWAIPKDLPDTIGVLAVISCGDDAVFEGVAPGAMPLVIEPLVRNNKRIVLRQMGTLKGASSNFWKWAKRIGIVVGVGGAALLLYEDLKHGDKKH